MAVCGLLLLAVGLVFGQTVRYDFVNYDDDEYVYENPHATDGLTTEGIAWAFTTSHARNWHPLTWLSHMLDCQFHVLHAGWHHLTNVLLHAATAVLLFLVLWQMMGDLWPSAFVAAVFAIHPLRVESVAWVSERKDVLGGLFFMLTLWAYVGYVRHPFSLARYLAVVALFALGLMAKPMLVTLPFVLLLLDYWPLGRMRVAGTLRVPSARSTSIQGQEAHEGRTAHGVCLLLCEKIPLLLLTAASCVATPLAQGEAIIPLDAVPLASRLANALVSYVAYLGQFFYPLGLAVFYPHPGVGLPIWKAAVALLVLAGISAAALAWRRRHPCLIVGWLWYLGMLVPVIGLVQVGLHAMADRYTYLPQIGLCIALAWLLKSFCLRRTLPHCNGGALGIASALVIAILMGCAWRQTSYWRDSESLWTRTLACTSRNSVAHNNLGMELVSQRRIDEAMTHYREALKIHPDDVVAHDNLGAALEQQGRIDEAMTHFQRALEIKPGYANARCNLGVALTRRGRIDEAVTWFRKALEIDPDHAKAHSNLGAVLARRGRIKEAMTHFQKALEIKPGYADAYCNLGVALVNQGRIDEAIAHFQKALEIDPHCVDAYSNLGAVLAGQGWIDEAMTHFRQALEIDPSCANAHSNLGLALAGQGRIGEAMTHFQQALVLAKQQNNETLAETLRARIRRYETNPP